MDVKVLKLVTGEDIICEYKEKDDCFVIIDNPIILATVPSEDGIGLALAYPWMAVSPLRKFEINKNHIICDFEPPKELYNHYNSEFGSGIVIANDAPNFPKILED